MAEQQKKPEVNGPKKQSLTTRVAKVSNEEEYYLIMKETKVTPRTKQDQYEDTCGDSCGAALGVADIELRWRPHTIKIVNLRSNGAS